MTLSSLANAAVLLTWAAPVAASLLLSLLGGRIPRRGLTLLSLSGSALPLLCGGFLLGLRWLDPGSAPPAPDGTALWALLLSSFLALGALWQAQRSVAAFSGRHRFYALMMLLLAAAGFLFTRAALDLAFLVGWEGLSLSGGFLAGFWAIEERGGRTGVHWLLLGRVSGLLLLLSLLTAAGPHPEWSTSLLLAAALVRAGVVPFHGTVPELGRSRSTAALLVQTLASWVPAVFLLDRVQDSLERFPVLLDWLLWLSLASVAFSLVAAMQPQAPQKIVGWLTMSAGSLALLGFAAGDPVAALTLCAGGALLLAGRFLLNGRPEAETGPDEIAAGPIFRLRAVSLASAVVAMAPPALWFAGCARLLAAAAGDERGAWITAAVFAVQFGMGAALRRLHEALPAEEGARCWPWPALLFSVGHLIVGAAGILLFGEAFWGGATGIRLGLGAVLAAGAGWLLAGSFARLKVAPRFIGARRLMELLADTGLGLGRLVILLPVGLAKALGVVLWRLLGDILIDGLGTGLPVRTVEGTGLVLRHLHDGRIRRTLLIAAWTALALLWAWTRS
ncbi:MAG: hypothetical protein GYA21_16285 [Myxococcales bacterium]|nr:hypothetical protein [Myxococcales bacterium]